MAHDPKTQDEKLRKLDAMVRDIGVAMLTTSDAQGRLHSRPMHLQGGVEDGRLYFFAYRRSPKVEELEHDRQVNCAFAEPDDNRYVSIAGTARIRQERDLMERMWNMAQKAWFPQGLDTPGICLIEVEVEDAQYWDAPNQAMVHLWGMVKAAVTGDRVGDPGDHEKLNL